MAAIHKKVFTSQKGLRSTGGSDLLKWGLPGGGVKSAKVAPTPYVYFPPVARAVFFVVSTVSLSPRARVGVADGDADVELVFYTHTYMGVPLFFIQRAHETARAHCRNALDILYVTQWGLSLRRRSGQRTGWPAAAAAASLHVTLPL